MEIIKRVNNNRVGKLSAKKRGVIVGIIVLALIGVSSWFIQNRTTLFTAKGKNSDKITSMYSDRIYSYNFYPTDYDEDIFADETYMGLNRYLQYKNGAETITITDGNYAKYGEAVEFFGKYFETVINGDYETYNTFFTDEYNAENEQHLPFTKQKLYDITVEQLSSTVNGDGSRTYVFKVSYSIRRNNGTFRNDIDSDAQKPLRFELIEKDGVVLINDIWFERSI